MRFCGVCEPLDTVSVAELVAWIRAIDFVDWPQQSKLADGKLRPAMINDPAWHDFGVKAAPVVSRLMGQFPGCAASNPMLSAVMPGHRIEPHVDAQAPDW